MDVMSKIEYFIDYKGLTKYAVEKKLGWSKNSISSSGAMKSDRLVKLIHLFDNLSLDWLLRDEGPMLRQNGTTENETDASNQLYIDGVPYYNPEFNYTEDDVKKFQKIKELKDQGYQLKIIKMLLSDDVMVSGGKVENEIAKVDDNEVVTKVESEHEDKLLQFKRLLNGMILEALNENNQVIEKEVSESIIKEVDYLLRVKEEADEDRYRQLDELIRSRQRKRRLFGKEKEKSQGLFKSRDLKTEYI